MRVERIPPLIALHFDAWARTVSIHSIGNDTLSPISNALIFGITSLARDVIFSAICVNC